jgi:uncharacterized protein
MTRLLRLALLFVLVSPGLLRAADIPFLSGRVVDDANILSPSARDRLGAALKAHEAATTNQVVVLTVPTIGSMSVEEYAVKVFEAWKLGQKGKDNGVLVVIVPQDRKMRIEVGYGLEGPLPDGACGEIIRTWMTPAFKAGNYDKGVEDGVAAIVARLEGRGGPVDRVPAGARASSSAGGSGLAPMPMTARLAIGTFVFGIIGLFTFIGLVTPGFGWFLYVFLIPFWAMFPLIILGPVATGFLLLAYVIGFPVMKLRLKRQPWYKKAAAELKSKGSTSIGGFTIGGSSSGGSSWSSGGGGGFSGGGGSSGGGGASGSW